MFQEKYSRSKHWFDLDIEWTQENFSTGEPQFFKRPFQSNIGGQDGIKYPTFSVSIGIAKEVGEVEYNPKPPLMEYHQNDSNSCCFISLESWFTAAGEIIMQGPLEL